MERKESLVCLACPVTLAPPLKVRRGCQVYLENKAGLASLELLVSEERTDCPASLALRAGREIQALQDLQERRGWRVCQVPLASLASLETKAVKELQGRKVSLEGKEAKAAADPRDCQEFRELRDLQGSLVCRACKV